MKNSTIFQNIKSTLEDQPTAVKVVVLLTLVVILLAAAALLIGLLSGATAAVFLSAPLATPKTRRDYFDELPEPYRSQAYENTWKEWRAEGYDENEINIVLNFTCTGIEHALNGAFTFRDTDQGHSYWSRASKGIFDTTEPTRAKIERILWYVLFAALAFGFIYMVGHTVELVLSLASTPLIATRSKMRKVKHFHIPQNLYAYSLPSEMTEREARAWARDWLNVNRLPNGTSFF